jgi:hypothetical protein
MTIVGGPEAPALARTHGRGRLHRYGSKPHQYIWEGGWLSAR